MEPQSWNIHTSFSCVAQSTSFLLIHVISLVSCRPSFCAWEFTSVLYFLLSSAVCSGAVTVDVVPKVEVLKGDTAQLPCKYTVSPSSTTTVVEWHIVSTFQMLIWFVYYLFRYSSFYHFSVSPSVWPSRRRKQEPGSAWLSDPKVAREKAMLAPLWLVGSLSGRTSHWPSLQSNHPMSSSSTVRSLLVRQGLEMLPLCSKSSVSQPMPLDVFITLTWTFPSWL